MEICVVFDKIKKDAVIGSINKLENALRDAAKEEFRLLTSKNIRMQMTEGHISVAPESTKITVILSDCALRNNSGIMLNKFKQKAIRLFSEFGIPLTADSLHVRIEDKIPAVAAAEPKDAANKDTSEPKTNTADNEFDYAQKSKQYVPTEPLYSFDRVILPADVVEKIHDAVGILACEQKVFRDWGLSEIQPHPSTALSFFGPSGTGKTMAAEAIAHKLGKKILKVSYADVESKYHGEGPKMVKAIFLAAQNEDAVLFFDEADSLLSKRLTNVTQGSEQAINSMRSQLLICLEEYHGIVIFATNLVVNYDQAFLTRLISIEFAVPDQETRTKIWRVHLLPLDDGKPHKLNIPLTSDVSIDALAEKYPFVGREIRNAVVSACVSAALAGQSYVSQDDLVKACEKIMSEKDALNSARGSISGTAGEMLKTAILNKINERKKEETDVPESTT